MANDALPVAGASYTINDKTGKILFSGLTNQNGESRVYELYAPNKSETLHPEVGKQPYGKYDVHITKSGFVTIHVIDVEIFDGETSIQPVAMLPLSEGEDPEETIVIPPPTCTEATPEQNNMYQPGRVLSAAESTPVLAAPQQRVIIPDFITVHLGTPANTSARTVRVPFIDYVKNVTSSEIFPTWPTNAIIANVHVIVTFALNRIYTEWYRSRGRNFDITNSTTVDQAFVYGRNIFQNISQIVDGIFNVFARRQGLANPFFTTYCNGTTSRCNGLSQWGTVTHANRGLTPIQILHQYYPRDLILTTAPTGTVTESFPGTLRQGSTGEQVRRMQERLNRIRANYPAIPFIPNPNGTFDATTTAAVRIFQRTFSLTQDGIVGRATWNRINQIWVAVTRMAELNAEGERVGLDPTPPTVIVRQGNRGANVIHVQFILNYLSNFHSDIPSLRMDGVFGPMTADAVRAFQRRFGLTADGIVGPNTWRRMYEAFIAAENAQPVPPTIIPPTTPPPVTPPPVTPPPTGPWPPYPGTLIRRGDRGENVRTLQQMLNNARRQYNAMPTLTVDGIFGPITENAVRTFQLFDGLRVDGIVGPITWNALRRFPR